MSITLGTGFHIGSKDLIYDKFVLSKDEMLNINENTYPDQFFALCSDDNKLYTFDINNTPNSETGKFRAIESGGSSADCYTKSEMDTKLDDYTKTEDLSTVIIDDTNTEATDKTLSSSKIIDEIQAIIDDTKATENNVLSAKYMLNNFEPRKEVVSKSKLTYATNYIRAYCDYSATIPATVRVTDDNGSVLLVTGSDNGSWRAVRLIKGDTDRFHKVYYNNGYIYIQVDNDSMYTIFGGSSVKVFGSVTGTEIPIEDIADTDIDIPTDCTADAVSYVNDTVGSATVEEALNKLISDYYYVAPSVTAFTASPGGGTYEIGTTITAPITFNWSYNKDITTQTLTDCTLADETVRTATYNTDISSNKTFTLTANDGKNNVSKNISYSFTNKVWYGSAAEGTYDDAFILGLSNGKLQTNKNGTYTVTVADREYFFIAMPQSYNNNDVLVGTIGGFSTEFGKVATLSHTNTSGYATNYNIYKSTNHSLGAISFII